MTEYEQDNGETYNTQQYAQDQSQQPGKAILLLVTFSI